jgi:hypothetical protein
MQGPVWSLWAFATAGYRRRLGRETSPKGHRPNGSGTIGQVGTAKVDWVARGPMGPIAEPAL